MRGRFLSEAWSRTECKHLSGLLIWPSIPGYRIHACPSRRSELASPRSAEMETFLAGFLAMAFLAAAVSIRPFKDRFPLGRQCGVDGPWPFRRPDFLCQILKLLQPVKIHRIIVQEVDKQAIVRRLEVAEHAHHFANVPSQPEDIAPVIRKSGPLCLVLFGRVPQKRIADRRIGSVMFSGIKNEGSGPMPNPVTRLKINSTASRRPNPQAGFGRYRSMMVWYRTCQASTSLRSAATLLLSGLAV